MYDRSIIYYTKLITYYGKLGRVGKAIKIFEEMPERNEVSCNAVLTVLIDSGQIDAARYFFNKMPYRNSASYTTMISGFSRFGFVNYAYDVFASIPLYHQNTVTWTSMIRCYVHNHQPGKALKLFSTSYGKLFSVGIVPNTYTFSMLLKSCGQVQSSVLAAQFHALIVKLLDETSEVTVLAQNALMDVQVKFGNFIEAEKLFNKMIWKDLCSYNIIMEAYADQQLSDKVLSIFHSMRVKDTLSWNTIITGLAKSDRVIDALTFFISFLRLWPKMKPNPCSYTIALSIGTTMTIIEWGRQIHTRIIKTGVDINNLIIGNALISMYSNCGSVEDAEIVFYDMTEKDTISWNTLILGLGRNGYSRKSLVLAKKALDLGAFNSTTFVGMLTSCSNGGLFEDGLEIFDLMNKKYRMILSLDHFICVVDLLGRAGKISEARNLLAHMPFPASPVAWETLLGSCLIHGNVEIGEFASRNLEILEPYNVSNHIMMANIYKKAAKLEESRKVLSVMKEKGLKKESGYSRLVGIQFSRH